jgi:large subunit ribosomal protein L5
MTRGPRGAARRRRRRHEAKSEIRSEMKARLYERYVKEVVPVLKEKRKYANVHEVPRMEKIVVNMGVSASLEKSAVDDAAKDLADHGPQAAISKSRHNIANFNLREGLLIGCRRRCAGRWASF